MRALHTRAAMIAVAFAAICFSTAGNAAEREFLDRFEGLFSGGGTVQRNGAERPNQVTCTLTGQPSSTGVSLTGQCGASIFSRDVRADIRFDEATGRYTGVYVGSAIGPAKLSGKRKGDAVTLTITWPKPVNGDTKATMTIRNSGNGSLAITVTDELVPGGARSKVTQLALNQS
jgi:hypothetical protein